MKTLKKNLALLLSGVLLAVLAIGQSAGVFAAVIPVQPDPTECVDCQLIQDDLDAAYADLGELIPLTNSFSDDMEALIDRAATNVYSGDTEMMIDNLDGEVISGHMLRGTICLDPANPFAYYSAFTYESQTYCFEDENMWFGVEPNYFNFFEHMMYLNEFWDAPSIPEWQALMDEWIEVLIDHNLDEVPGLMNIHELIDSLIIALQECEDSFCAVPECPDCEVIAADLETALDDLTNAEAEADTLDQELTDIESDMSDIENQLSEWAQLKADFEAMVEDAGGKHGADCDGFEVGSGQGWGIAHNFGNVQWCFTNEGQIEDMITNLDEYWQTHSSTHLPTEATLMQQLDDLMNEYVAKLIELDVVLKLIDDLNLEIDLLSAELELCLDELEALQADGYCLDQDAAALRAIVDSADGLFGWAGGDATNPEVTPEETPEETTDLEDIIGHWAEEFIRELFGAGVVAGDGDTGLFRPNDNLNRAEASKMLLLSNADTQSESFSGVFSDVEESSWFWPFVNAAQDLGYFNGYEDGSFGPGNNILRAEAIAVVMRALGFDIPEYTEYSFPDVTGDEWFADYAEKAYQCELVAGREGNFEGGETITRAEMSKILDLAFFKDLVESDCIDFECPVCEAGDTVCEADLAVLQASGVCLTTE